MRFLYFAASLALFAATTEAFSTGSPKCKSSDDVLQTMAQSGKMGKQADAAAFAKTWSFSVWDENGKEVSGKVMTNMKYTVTVNGGDYNGVITYPVFNAKRIPVADEKKVFSLDAEDDFQMAKCSGTDGATVTHTNADDKKPDTKVASVMLMDADQPNFSMWGIVVTASGKFGKVVSPTFSVQAGKGGDNNTDDGTDSDDGTDDTDDSTDTTGGDGSNPSGTDGSPVDSASLVRPALALQLIALAVVLLA